MKHIQTAIILAPRVTIISIVIMLLSACSNSVVTTQSDKSNAQLVVLVHGLGRSDWAMWHFSQRLEDAGYHVCRLDYATIGESVADVLTETSEQIDSCILNASNNTGKVHFVGHSLGGLIIRAYLQPHRRKLDKARIGKLVLIGTPNKGSELADHVSDTILMKIGGGISRALVTGSKSLGNNLDELNIEVGVIAGTKALSLTEEQFTGRNDGVVSVASTQLASMSDFIEIEVGHSQMRYDPQVTKQTIYFLQHGRFKH